MLNIYSHKVNALTLLMSQLEEKIAQEQQAREDLARTYEQSLNTGVARLNNEAEILAENPLVKEISLLVAKELMKQGRI
jgi:hypothetical protein